MKGVRRQLTLLGHASGFRLLFFATLGSSLGTLLATVALVRNLEPEPWVTAGLVAVAVYFIVVGLTDRLSSHDRPAA